MKPIDEKRLEAFEQFALEDCLTDLKAFRAYQGDNPKYYQKAKMAATSISGFARIRASESNRMAVEHSIAVFAQKQISGDKTEAA
jgi:hypothetical protein